MMRHAAQRMALNYGPGGRRWGEHYEIAGIETEASLAIATGSEVKMEFYEHGGDGGVDKWLWLQPGQLFCERKWVRADAKGVWKTPKFMLIPTRDLVHRTQPLTLDPINGVLQVGAVRPDTIYIQGYRPPGQGKDENNIGPWPLNGFAWGHKVMQYPAAWYWDNNRYVHMVPSLGPESVLHPIEELIAMYCDRWRHPFGPPQLAEYCDDVLLRGGYGRQPLHGGGPTTQEIGHVPRITRF